MLRPTPRSLRDASRLHRSTSGRTRRSHRSTMGSGRGRRRSRSMPTSLRALEIRDMRTQVLPFGAEASPGSPLPFFYQKYLQVHKHCMVLNQNNLCIYIASYMIEFVIQPSSHFRVFLSRIRLSKRVMYMKRHLYHHHYYHHIRW